MHAVLQFVITYRTSKSTVDPSACFTAALMSLEKCCITRDSVCFDLPVLAPFKGRLSVNTSLQETTVLN